MQQCTVNNALKMLRDCPLLWSAAQPRTWSHIAQYWTWYQHQYNIFSILNWNWKPVEFVIIGTYWNILELETKHCNFLWFIITKTSISILILLLCVGGYAGCERMDIFILSQSQPLMAYWLCCCLDVQNEIK